MTSRRFMVVTILIMLSSTVAYAGDIITVTEIENCFYADAKMKCSKGEFRNTYYREGGKIVRTNVFNIKKKESISDDTTYTVIHDLSSDPRNNDGTVFPRVTRAIGTPGTDSLEIIVMDDKYMQSVKSTSNYFSISRYKIE